jgi:hypothetical protein
MFRIVPMAAIVLLSMSVSPSYADQNTAIRINLEEPKAVEEAAYSGISNLRGWAVAPAGIARVEIYVDGVYSFDVPMGGVRGDVSAAFPEYPDSDKSGFSMAYNYKSLDPGTHAMTARAVDENGDYNEQSVSFSTNRFISEYIGQPTDIDFTSTTELEVGERAFRLKGVTIESKKWDIGFIWDSATQGMELMSIQESDSN